MSTANQIRPRGPDQPSDISELSERYTALGRDAAGVHYRSDGVEGIKLGEAIAISILRDTATLTTRCSPGLVYEVRRDSGDDLPGVLTGGTRSRKVGRNESNSGGEM